MLKGSQRFHADSCQDSDFLKCWWGILARWGGAPEAPGSVLGSCGGPGGDFQILQTIRENDCFSCGASEEAMNKLRSLNITQNRRECSSHSLELWPLRLAGPWGSWANMASMPPPSWAPESIRNGLYRARDRGETVT